MNWYLKAFKQYGDFGGRARRKEYWMFFLFHMLFSYGSILLASILDVPALLFAAVIYLFATFVPALAITVRRMHDLGKNGWYALIPFYNLYLCCLNGELIPNQYGENPKKRQEVILQKV